MGLAGSAQRRGLGRQGVPAGWEERGSSCPVALQGQPLAFRLSFRLGLFFFLAFYCLLTFPLRHKILEIKLFTALVNKLQTVKSTVQKEETFGAAAYTAININCTKCCSKLRINF